MLSQRGTRARSLSSVIVASQQISLFHDAERETDRGAVATFYLVTKLRYDRYLTPLDWGGAVGGTYVGTSPVILFFCSVSIHTFLIAT